MWPRRRCTNPTVSYGVYGRVQGQATPSTQPAYQAWPEQPVLLGTTADDARQLGARRRPARGGRGEFGFEVAVEARRRSSSPCWRHGDRRAAPGGAGAELGACSTSCGAAPTLARRAPMTSRGSRWRPPSSQPRRRRGGRRAGAPGRPRRGWSVAGWSPVARGPFPVQGPAAVARPPAHKQRRSRSRARSWRRGDGWPPRRSTCAAPSVSAGPSRPSGVGAYLTTDGASASL